MDIKFQKGDEVVIVGYEKTKKRYGVNSVMIGMYKSEKQYKVEYCTEKDVKVNNYYWVPDDVGHAISFKATYSPKVKIFHYDISNLEV